MSKIVKKDDDIMDMWDGYWSSKETDKIFFRNKLIEYYLYIVSIIATKVHENTGFDVDDLKSYGVDGLIAAIKNYDRTRQVKFESFCKLRIYGSMYDELRRINPIPRSIAINHKKFEQNKKKIQDSGDPFVSDEEVFEQMGVKEKQKHYYTPKFEDINISSNSKCFVTNGEMKIIEKESFYKIIEPLTYNQKKIIIYFFRDGMKLNAICEKMGYSDTWVHLQLKSAITKLREIMSS